MTELHASDRPARLPWIEGRPEAPLCDVPWRGRAIVLSDGKVNFCCFSRWYVGNVNEQPFERIWNGERMQSIRRALAEQRLPPECQSTACPIHRGDAQHFIVDRIEGPFHAAKTGTDDPHAWRRRDLAGSGLRPRPAVAGGTGAPGVDLHLSNRGEPFQADLFVAVRAPDGALAFAPDGSDFPVPWALDLEVGSERRFEILELGASRPGDHEVWAALFEPGSNPNLASNCYWSAGASFASG